MANANVAPQPRMSTAQEVAPAGSYVEWGAVSAGIVAVLGVSFVLLSFGAAVGFSAVSPWTATAGTITAVSLGAAFWLLLVNLWAFALGGYLAGRMRHRWHDAQQAEVDFRDSAHGLLAWAGAVTLAAALGGMIASGSPSSTDRNAGNPILALTVDKVDWSAVSATPLPSPTPLNLELSQ